MKIAALVLGILFLALTGSGASAQASRTWVSGTGDDANPCSRTAPCKTFAGAISKTAAAGEINVIDTGGYGAVTITKSITIRSDHVEAGVLVSGTNGVVVNAGATDTVVLEGLDFDGLNHSPSSPGLNGVNITSGGTVYIIRCAIRRFAQNGVNMVSSSSGARVFIEDSIINLNNGGVNVQGSGGASNFADIVHSVIDGNTSFAIQATGSGNGLGVTSSVLADSPTAISVVSGGMAVSVGPSNAIIGLGSFTSTIPFK